MPTWTVVVPTNRPEQFEVFLSEWVDLFVRHDVFLIVVQDLPKHDEGIRNAFERSGLEGELHHQGTITMEYCPRKSDMIRSWGIYRAWKGESDYVLTLDDDTKPFVDIFEHYQSEFDRPRPHSPYLSVGAMTSARVEMRGFPYNQRKTGKVMVQYGGWNGVLDYDALTQLAGVREDEHFWPYTMPVPKGAAATCCIMNAAWRREFSREMWQLPLYEGRYNRFGDIWSGLIQKKVLDRTDGVMLINGRASVLHERASNPKQNLRREKPGIPANEGIWEHLSKGDPWDDFVDPFAYYTASVAYYFNELDPEYAEHFRNARVEWLGLFGAPKS